MVGLRDPTASSICFCVMTHVVVGEVLRGTQRLGLIALDSSAPPPAVPLQALRSGLCQAYRRAAHREERL